MARNRADFIRTKQTFVQKIRRTRKSPLRKGTHEVRRNDHGIAIELTKGQVFMNDAIHEQDKAETAAEKNNKGAGRGSPGHQKGERQYANIAQTEVTITNPGSIEVREKGGVQFAAAALATKVGYWCRFPVSFKQATGLGDLEASFATSIQVTLTPRKGYSYRNRIPLDPNSPQVNFKIGRAHV